MDGRTDRPTDRPTHIRTDASEITRPSLYTRSSRPLFQMPTTNKRAKFSSFTTPYTLSSTLSLPCDRSIALHQADTAVLAEVTEEVASAVEE